MTTDTRTDAERRYDAERDGTLYTAQPTHTDEPLSADEETVLNILLAIDGGELAPEVLTLDAARAQALRGWKGHTTTNDAGEFRRYPELPPVEIGALFDGTPVIGAFDNDDEPRSVDLNWGGFSIIAECQGFDFSDDKRDYGHVTYEQWARFVSFVTSGALEHLRDIVAEWEGQGTIGANITVFEYLTNRC